MTGLKRVNIYTGQQKPTTRNKPNLKKKKTQKLIIICKRKRSEFILSAWLILMPSKRQTEVREEGVHGERVSHSRLKSRP